MGKYRAYVFSVLGLWGLEVKGLRLRVQELRLRIPGAGFHYLGGLEDCKHRFHFPIMSSMSFSLLGEEDKHL